VTATCCGAPITSVIFAISAQGQVFSTRADLLATEFVEELGRPQPGASPVPWAQVPGLTEIERLLVSDVRSAQLR
jgi:hypothetical protein